MEYTSRNLPPIEQPNEKAPAVLADETSANENFIQDNNTTVLNKYQIPVEILKELTEMQKRYREIYRNSGLAGISESNVHLSESAFLETFTDYETGPFVCSDSACKEELFAFYNDVKFFCIR